MIRPAEEFRRYAIQCRGMALDTPDKESKAIWNRLADRWVRCAELEEARPAPDLLERKRAERLPFTVTDRTSEETIQRAIKGTQHPRA